MRRTLENGCHNQLRRSIVYDVHCTRVSTVVCMNANAISSHRHVVCCFRLVTETEIECSRFFFASLCSVYGNRLFAYHISSVRVCVWSLFVVRFKCVRFTCCWNCLSQHSPLPTDRMFENNAFALVFFHCVRACVILGRKIPLYCVYCFMLAYDFFSLFCLIFDEIRIFPLVFSRFFSTLFQLFASRLCLCRFKESRICAVGLVSFHLHSTFC